MFRRAYGERSELRVVGDEVRLADAEHDADLVFADGELPCRSPSSAPTVEPRCAAATIVRSPTASIVDGQFREERCQPVLLDLAGGEAVWRPR